MSWKSVELVGRSGGRRRKERSLILDAKWCDFGVGNSDRRTLGYIACILKGGESEKWELSWRKV